MPRVARWFGKVKNALPNGDEPEPRRGQHRDCSPERLPRQAQVGAAREPKPQRRQRREKQCQTPCVAQGGGIRGFDLQHARMQNCPQGERGRDHQQSCHDEDHSESLSGKACSARVGRYVEILRAINGR